MPCSDNTAQIASIPKRCRLPTRGQMEAAKWALAVIVGSRLTRYWPIRARGSPWRAVCLRTGSVRCGLVREIRVVFGAAFAFMALIVADRHVVVPMFLQLKAEWAASDTQLGGRVGGGRLRHGRARRLLRSVVGGSMQPGARDRGHGHGVAAVVVDVVHPARRPTAI